MISPYYSDSSVTLFCGDCREILPELRADVIITDVPYNCGINYGETTNDNLPWPLAGGARWVETAFAAIEGEARPVDFDRPRTPPWRGTDEGN